jgi:hypothetical protein
LGYNNLSYELLAIFLLIHEEGKSYQFLRSENERGWFRRRQWESMPESVGIAGCLDLSIWDLALREPL